MASVRLKERTWVMYLINSKSSTQLATISIPLTLGGKGICAKGGKGDTEKSYTEWNKRLCPFACTGAWTGEIRSSPLSPSRPMLKYSHC